MEHLQQPVNVMSANHLVMSAVQSSSMPQKQQQGNSTIKKVNSKPSGCKKETDKPKRPLSAYNLFFQAERAKILQSTPSKYEGNKPRRSHGKIGFASLARSVAAKWNNIDPETRKHFDQLAAEDKARYKTEMEAWKASQTLKRSTRDFSTTSSSCLSPPFSAQSIAKCNLMAASQASQDSGRLVFAKFQSVSRGGSHAPAAPPSARFFFHNVHTNDMRCSGKASAVVGQALALLGDDSMPTFQPLDDCTLESVERDTVRRGSGSSPHISELAAKLDDDCLGFMSELLF